MTRFHALCAGLLVAAVAQVAHADDIGVAGTKLIIVDKTAAGSAKAVFVSKDANITKGVATDLGTIFSELWVQYDGAGGTFEMPGGPGWIVNKETVAKYLNNPAPSGGAVKVSVIKPGSLIKVVGKGLGDEPIDISTPPTGSVFVTHLVLNADIAARHCTEFTSCSHKVIAGGTGYKLVCLGGLPDPACSGAPTPVCCNQIPTLPDVCGYLPSAMLCQAAGGVPGGSGDVCDAVTGTCGPSASPGACCEGLPSPFGTLCVAGPTMGGGNCPTVFSASAVCGTDQTCH